MNGTPEDLHRLIYETLSELSDAPAWSVKSSVLLTNRLVNIGRLVGRKQLLTNDKPKGVEKHDE